MEERRVHAGSLDVERGQLGVEMREGSFEERAMLRVAGGLEIAQRPRA